MSESRTLGGQFNAHVSPAWAHLPLGIDAAGFRALAFSPDGKRRRGTRDDAVLATCIEAPAFYFREPPIFYALLCALVRGDSRLWLLPAWRWAIDHALGEHRAGQSEFLASLIVAAPGCRHHKGVQRAIAEDVAGSMRLVAAITAIRRMKTRPETIRDHANVSILRFADAVAQRERGRVRVPFLVLADGRDDERMRTGAAKDEERIALVAAAHVPAGADTGSVERKGAFARVKKNAQRRAKDTVQLPALWLKCSAHLGRDQIVFPIDRPDPWWHKRSIASSLEAVRRARTRQFVVVRKEKAPSGEWTAGGDGDVIYII